MLSLIISIISFVIVIFITLAIFFKSGLNNVLSGTANAIIDLEKYKEQDKLNQKRDVYVELIHSMAVFINGRVPADLESKYKQEYLNAYDKAWLWASDSVLEVLSEYMQFKLDKINDQQKEKTLFAKCVLEMRKDLGFSSSKITIDNYKFINF